MTDSWLGATAALPPFCTIGTARSLDWFSA
jgi:hypothetical protein